MDRLGDYRLRQKLAAGGMGEVYLGEKIGPEGFVKPVVLKCVLPQLATDRGFVQLFLDEARLAALLNHPNIAQVYDFGVVDGTYFIAMEYVPGYTFENIRQKLVSIGQHMPLQHIAHVASQACQGLHYAHALTDGRGESLGLVHRDVSPHNLIVSVDGTVKLVDFGIAMARSGLTRVRAKGAVGKHGYASPEQSRGEPVDGRSDVFSLGICLWELTTNQRMWPANLDKAPDYRPDVPLRGVDTARAEVPRQFVRILETALAVDRERRFDSAREMHLELERFQAALTHYAGQAALAEFIADLVGGRVGGDAAARAPVGRNFMPTADMTSGDLSRRRGAAGETPSADLVSRDPRSDAPLSDPAGTPRRVPVSWDGASNAGRRVGGTTEVEFEDVGDVPELARAPRPTSRAHSLGPPSRGDGSASRRARRGSRGRRPLRWALGLLLLGGAVIGLSGPIADGVRRLMGADPSRGADRPVGSPAAPSTRAYIDSSPPGARVWIDGRELANRTPLEVELMPEVEHRIEVGLDGWSTAAQRVVGKLSTQSPRLEFDLDPAATLDIRSSPPGARVWVDGRELEGVTPLVVTDAPAGRAIRVRLVGRNNLPAVRQVRLQPGESTQLDFELGREASTE